MIDRSTQYAERYPYINIKWQYLLNRCWINSEWLDGLVCHQYRLCTLCYTLFSDVSQTDNIKQSGPFSKKKEGSHYKQRYTSHTNLFSSWIFRYSIQIRKVGNLDWIERRATLRSHVKRLWNVLGTKIWYTNIVLLNVLWLYK